MKVILLIAVLLFSFNMSFADEQYISIGDVYVGDDNSQDPKYQPGRETIVRLSTECIKEGFKAGGQEWINCIEAKYDLEYQTEQMYEHM